MIILTYIRDLRTHTSGEELDRFSGYSDQPEPYHPPLLQQGPGHQRRRHPAHHQPNPGWDRIPSGYAEEDPEKAIPRSEMFTSSLFKNTYTLHILSNANFSLRG